MADFELEMEFRGFSIRMKGKREDVPRAMDHIGNQLLGLVKGPQGLVDDRPHRATVNPIIQPAPALPSARKAPNGRRKNGRTDNAAPAAAPEALQWKHDPGKWGNAKQGWKLNQKVAWLLYIVEQELSVSELSAPAICVTFNHHFREAGQLIMKNMKRDLGLMKQKSPPLIGENGNSSPSTYFLTEAGKALAVKMIEDARGSQNGGTAS